VIVYFDLGETNIHKHDSFSRQFRDYPDLLRSKRFWGYCLSATFASGAFFSFLGGGPLVATSVLNLSPIALGNYLILLAGGYMVGSFFSGQFSETVGVRSMVLFGAAISFLGTSITLGLFVFGIFNVFTLFLPISLVGLGNGICLPNATSGFVSVNPKLAGSASGLGGAMMIGGGTILAVITGNLMLFIDGPAALLGVMWASNLLGVACAIFVYITIANMQKE
ncbi:MAG: Bcr/CflA family drug resistance efflux transporter, partial [Pseudomonadota bacterium]